jgi:hypothetical protein
VGDSGISDLTIENANVTGTSSTSNDHGGSGIGTGCAVVGDSAIGNLSIENANVTGISSTGGSNGGSGVGTGSILEGGASPIALLLLSGILTVVCDSLRAANLLVANASIFIFTPTAGLFESTPTLSGSVALTIFYGTATNVLQEPWLTGIPFLSIGNFSLPQDGEWHFCVPERRCSPSAVGDVQGLLTSVPGEGSYSIVAEGPSRGFLGPTEDDNVFPVSPNGSFFPAAYFTAIASTPRPTPAASPTDAFVESALAISSPIGESPRPNDSPTHLESAACPASAGFAPSSEIGASGEFGASELLPVGRGSEASRLPIALIAGIGGGAGVLMIVTVIVVLLVRGKNAEGIKPSTQQSGRSPGAEVTEGLNDDVVADDDDHGAMSEL